MKEERIVLKTEHHESEGLLFLPANAKTTGVILGHGAGGNMHSEFMSYFQRKIAEAGYACMKFNFPYSQNKRKFPDPQPVLMASYRKAIEAMPSEKVVIGGKSMGGRIASYVADSDKVCGLLFLGYPLHAPGKVDQLRDEHLYRIQKPMLFISGTKDPFAREDLLLATLKKIGKNAQLHAVDGGGHSLEVSRKTGPPAAEIRTAVADAIVNWLKSL
jgi:predicted alpha/beta-hydrolase family hydrolase